MAAAAPCVSPAAASATGGWSLSVAPPAAAAGAAAASPAVPPWSSVAAAGAASAAGGLLLGEELRYRRLHPPVGAFDAAHALGTGPADDVAGVRGAVHPGEGKRRHQKDHRQYGGYPGQHVAGAGAERSAAATAEHGADTTALIVLDQHHGHQQQRADDEYHENENGDYCHADDGTTAGSRRGAGANYTNEQPTESTARVSGGAGGCNDAREAVGIQGSAAHQQAVDVVARQQRRSVVPALPSRRTE